MIRNRSLNRWVAFNGVGAIGVLVQLVALAALIRFTHLHYLAATALAVEAAVVHNFIWHQRWTWRDRGRVSCRTVAARLARFHLLNGLISLVGNVTIMRILIGTCGLDPILSNVASIALCSTANFFASDICVFRQQRAFGRAAGITLASFALAGTATVHAVHGEPAAELKPATLAAWNAYQKIVDARYTRLSESVSPFFAEDEFGVGNWRQTALAGGVAMSKMEAASPGSTQVAVPDGRIHHWTGAVFVPGEMVDRVVRRVQEYAGRESESYQDVLASRLLWREGDRLRVFMKLRRESIITVTYNTEHTVQYRRLGTARASSRSEATKIAELSNPGTPDEREKPPGSDNGFLWRLNAYWRYEQIEGGVLIECESVSLSRSVPLVLRPFVTGTVERIARESLEKTLRSLRGVLTRGRP